MTDTFAANPAPETLPAGAALEALRARFLEQDEFLLIEDFLPRPMLDGLLAALPALQPHVHRNFIPGHKKGGSISRFDLDRLAPAFPELYRWAALREFLAGLTGQKLLPCPEDDPHTYALYYYTEPGDHIGWHYDTSYYRGSRYTILVGLVDRSTCRLEYELYRKTGGRPVVSGGAGIAPGTLVVFNGDKLWHRVSPMAAGEERVVLTLEFVTDVTMNPFARFVSNMKDAIAYFGLKQVFARPGRRAA